MRQVWLGYLPDCHLALLLEQQVRWHVESGVGPSGLVDHVLVRPFHVVVVIGGKVGHTPLVAVSRNLQPVPQHGCSCVAVGS